LYVTVAHRTLYTQLTWFSARTRWHNLRQKIVDGSFFVLSKPLIMSNSNDFASGLQTRPGLDVNFAQIFASAQQTVQSNPQSSLSDAATQQQQPLRLADMHTARAAENTQAPSTFESQQQNVALKRMSNFISANMSNIRRLSRLPVNYDFSEVMAAYGKQPVDTLSNLPSMPSRSHIKTPSELISNVNPSTQARVATPPLPAPQAVRANIQTPSLETNIPQLSYRKSPLPSSPVQNYSTHASSPSESISGTYSPATGMSVATMHMNRRLPPRSSTPLPASPRASLALSASALRRKVSTDVPPVPVAPNAVAELNAMKLAGSMNGDELRFQQLQTRN
jgi:hypothetical protein